MRVHPILMAVSLLVGSMGVAPAQTYPDQPAETGTEQYGNPTGAHPANPANLNANVANPYANAVAPRKSTASPRIDDSSPFPAAAQRHNSPTDPAKTAATRQSGLTDVQARSILQQRGYTRIGDLQANPNSIWVWQADAVKNGQRVRLGIDYRGNLLELGSSASPCAGPQAGFGRQSPLGTGVRLSESNSCSNR